MEDISGWDIALFVVAGYVAVMSMTRMMIRRREELLVEFRERMKTERERKQTEEARKTQAKEDERLRKAA